MEALSVKVQNGVTHIIARLGEVLLYIETSASGLTHHAKVWVLGVAGTTQSRLVSFLEPAHATLKRTVSALLANIEVAVLVAKCNTLGVLVPIQVAVHDGVVYVQAFVATTYVSIAGKAASTWAKSTVFCSRVYDSSLGALTSRVQSASQRSYALANAATLHMCNAIEPVLMRAKDGCLYVQTSVSNTVVRVKVGVLTQRSRIAACACRVGANVTETVHSLTAPAIQRIVAVYEKLRSQLVAFGGPCLERLQGLRSRLTTIVGGILVGMRVRAASARELALRYPSMYYAKMKGGCVYLYGFVGDKVVGIKVQINEIISKVNATLIEVCADTRGKFVVVKDSLQANALVVGESIKGVASDRSVQATAAGSISGSAALGASGGATGLASGTMIGAACGLVPAVFTFGLSIPICAAIGGTTGLFAGTVAGSTVGFVGGGLAGRTAHKHRAQIGDGVAAVASKASDFKAIVKDRSSECLDQISGKVSDCKSAIVGKTLSAGGA